MLAVTRSSIYSPVAPPPMLLPEAGCCLSRYDDIIAQKPGLSTSSIDSMLLATFFAIPGDRGSCFPSARARRTADHLVNLGMFLLYVLNTWILFEHEY